MPPRTLSPKPLLDEPSVMEVLDSLGIARLHAQTMWKYIVKNRVSSIHDVPQLPKAMYAALSPPAFVVSTSTVTQVQHSADGLTTKLLLTLQDGQAIESVIMRYGKRSTICISSQVGCKMGCKFCATGTLGLSGNLWPGEMLEQLYHANGVTPIRNVVYMGMGEPLDNYDAVVTSFRGMVDRRRFNLSAHHITVSTVGVIPRMRTLARDAPGVRLALSLHAPTQDLRVSIVPTASAWPIERLVEAMDYYVEQSPPSRNGCNVLIEYVVIGGVNDLEEHAHQLADLLVGRGVLINLIPYNPTDVEEKYVPPTDEAVDKFHAILRDRGFFATVRREMGQDISGACGQLVLEAKGNAEVKQGPLLARDIEDLLNGGGGCAKVPTSTAAAPTPVAGAGAASGFSGAPRAVPASTPAAPVAVVKPVTVSHPEQLWAVFIAVVTMVLLAYLALKHSGSLPGVLRFEEL